MNNVMTNPRMIENYWLPLRAEPQELAKSYRAYIHKKRCCENADRVIKKMKKKERGVNNETSIESIN